MGGDDMNTWKRLCRFFLTPAGVGIAIIVALVAVPGLWEAVLGRVDLVLDATHTHFLVWANRHGGDFVTGFLLVLGGIWLWRKGAGGGSSKGKK
ncbi:MAG: hypothetical protein WCZ69_02330 [Candidatus Paceibacterota bacterium]